MALAFDGEHMRVASSVDHTVSKLTLDGEVIGEIPVGTGPLALALDGENIWVANSGIETPGVEPQEPGTLSKLALDGTVTGTFPVGMMPFALAFDGDSIWVANLGDDTVMKLDLDGNVSDTFSLGEQPRDFVFDGQNMWVLFIGSRTATRSTLTKLSLDGSVLARFPVNGFLPQALGFDGEAIWVSNGDRGTVTRLSLDGAELGTFPVGGNTLDFVFDGAVMWVSDGVAGTVTDLAPDGTALGTFPGDSLSGRGVANWGLAFDGESIWVANFASIRFGSSVTRLTPGAAELVTFPVDGLPLALTYGGESMWIAKQLQKGGFAVTRMSLKGAELVTFPVVLGEFGALAFDGENIWVSDILSGDIDHGIVGGPGVDVVVKLAPDGAVLGTFLVGPDPSALAFDGKNIIVPLGNDTLVELSLDGTKVGTFKTGALESFDGESLWLIGDEIVTRVALDGTIIGTLFADGVGFRSPIVFDGERIWIGGRENLFSISLDLRNLFPLDSFPIVAGALAFDGNSVWIAGAEESTVSRLTLLKPPPLASEVERFWVQTFLGYMMAEKGVASVAPSANSTNSWSDNPTGQGSAPLHPDYLRNATTTYFYCWTSSGKITSQGESAVACPAEN